MSIFCSFLVLFEIGNSSRAYCEHAGRTEPVVGDVVIALVNLGLSTDGLEAHAKRPGRTVVSAPAQSSQPKQPSILQAGVKQSPPSHIPPHLPAFPDPHAYIRTPTHKQPVTEYEAIREKAAQQKRDVERALTRFIARTGDTHSLFPNNDSNMFPLIACKPQHPPYLKALLPLDQVFDFEEEIGPQNIPAAAGKPGDSATNIKGEQPSPNRPRQKTKQNTQTDHEDADEDGATVKEQPSEEAKTETDIIDNPYLRPVKMPRKKIKK